MLGAVAGDIIGSPYEIKNANDKDFELCKSVRGWKNGSEVSYYPRITDETVMTLAVAKWMMKDEEHNRSTLVSILKDMCLENIDRGFSPTMKIWARSEYGVPFPRDTNDGAARVSPIGLMASSLTDALHLARMATQITHDNPDSIKGAQALTEAIWLIRHGRSKEDIRSVMENDYGLQLSLNQEDMKALLMGALKEPIMVNCIETGEYYYRETGKIDHGTINTVTASMKAFCEGDGFEDVVRRAVALGGDSDTIASMAAAMAEPYYKGVPENIVRLCSDLIPSDLKSLMDSFEAAKSNKVTQKVAEKVPSVDELAFNVIKCPDSHSKIYVVASYRKDLIAALKEKFGDDIRIIKPSQMEETYRKLLYTTKYGTYLETGRPEIRTLYFQDGKFKTALTLEGPGMPDMEVRMASMKQLAEIRAYAEQVKAELQHRAGYNGEFSIHFQNAYYPIISHDMVEIFKGDILAGSVGLDPKTGLLRIDQGGDFGPMEWFGDRTESVFNSVSLDAIKESIGRYCLDEGVGIHDANRKLNVDTANLDLAESKCPVLNWAMENEKPAKRLQISLSL